MAHRLGVDAPVELSASESARRLQRDGPNQLAETPPEPRWGAYLRQFTDLLIIILLVAAVVSLVVTGEWETPAVIAGGGADTDQGGSSVDCCSARD